MQILQTVAISGSSEVGREPDVCYGGDNHLVVWSQGEFGGGSQIRAARVSPAGVVLDTGIVCGMDHYCEYRPSVAFDGEHFFVVWYNYVDPPAGIFGRFIGQDCIPIGREVLIRDLPINTNNDPDIAFLDSVYLIVWSEPSPSYDDDVYGQIVHMNGTLIGEVIPIGIGSLYQYQPRVCAADTMFLAVWQQNSYIYGQFIATDGTCIGGNFQISDPPPHPRDFPDIGYGGPQPLTLWHEFVYDDHEIYGDMEIFPGISEETFGLEGTLTLLPTILVDQLIFPFGENCTVYDITGRQIHHRNPVSGIYFIAIDRQIVTKVIKVR